jgi:hypothetical protein
MATVIYLPEDKRFQMIGEGLGSLIGALAGKRIKESQEDVLRSAYTDALNITQGIAQGNTPPSAEQTQELFKSLSDAKALDQAPQFIEMITKLQGQRLSQQSAAAFAEGLKNGDLSSAIGTAASQPGQTLEGLSKLSSIFENLQPPAGGGPKNPVGVKFYDPSGNERELQVPQAIAAAGDAAIQGWAQTQPGLSGLTTTKPNLPGARVETEKERDVAAFVRNRAGDPTNQRDLDRGRNVIDNRKTANLLLLQHYTGVVSDNFEEVMAALKGKPAEDRVKHSLALPLIDDILFTGADPNDAWKQAVEEAELRFTTGQFIPASIREGGPEAVQSYLEKNRVGTSLEGTLTSSGQEIVEYSRSLSTAKDSGQPEDSRRSALLGMIKLENPKLTLDELRQIEQMTFQQLLELRGGL